MSLFSHKTGIKEFRIRTLALVLPLALAGVSATRIPWEELTPVDWIYSLATRFSAVDGHSVHYPTPTAELAHLLEGRKEVAALRHLAEAKRALGDCKGAQETMEKWAATETAVAAATGAEAWAETARWAASHQDMAAAFRAAEQALPGLGAAAKRALADLRVTWAEQHPDQGDAMAYRRARAGLFPEDAQVLEVWLRALEKAGRLEEADHALASAKALTPERNLLLRADLQADHGDNLRAFQILDGAVAQPWSIDFRRAYAQRVQKAAAALPETWRNTLDARFDGEALVRLATYFQGQNRGDAAAGLLRQVERRHEKTFGRKDFLLLARLHGEIDAAPEAFRATLAAAHLGTPDEQTADLAALSRLALRAGGRPLAWGTYNDEAYRWVASLDRTPGFWTGGISFLLTGQDWKEALEHLESESLSDRTFATARTLAEALAKRAPRHPDLPALRVALMERHVERGEGSAALALLPRVEGAPPAVADEARRVALLAARQVTVGTAEEMRLYQARLRFLAADGTKLIPGAAPAGEPGYRHEEDSESEGSENEEGNLASEEPRSRPWSRLPRAPETPGYHTILDEALARLEYLDQSHRTSLQLILGEMDRMPDAEALWMMLASRLEGWNLDDELGPRYQAALKRFDQPGIWSKAARWYARRNYQADLRRLAEDIAAQFRGAALFEKVGDAGILRLEIPEQPRIHGAIRMVAWADWIRFKALERFPHSPKVFREAGSLWTATRWQTWGPKWEKEHLASIAEGSYSAPVVAPDSLLEERGWAVLFADPGQREVYLAEAMHQGTLEGKLRAMEAKVERTPVENQLLFEGWARLSRFERAAQPADLLAASYPGDGALAQRVLSLHRSLNSLESSHAAPAHTVVERTAPALDDPGQLWTELGEMEEDRGRPGAAAVLWQNLLAREPRNPDKVSQLATLLWDYNHDREALTVIEEGRKRLGRPRFFAFETGVLRENVKDLEGAVREYLDAVRPENASGYGSWFENDQRSLRRLMQLMSREKPYRLVERRIKGLLPGVAEDERTLAAFFPLATIDPPDPGHTWDADSWIDAMDLPNDPKGREQREDKKGANRPKEYDAVRLIGDVLLEKMKEMVPQATVPEFLDAAEHWSRQLIPNRWPKEAIVTFQNTVLARKAKLAPTEEERIRLEIARAGFLSASHRGPEADAVWAALDTRIGALPEGTLKLHAEADRASYLERAKGTTAAAQEWRRITGRYPWSLGLLDDRIAFLNRAGLGAEALALLEEVVPKAASGHREALLERLTRDALTAGDLPRTRRAVERLLAETSLEELRRLGAVHLLARLSLKENPAWDSFALGKSEAAKLKPEFHADLYHELARAADLEGAGGPALGLWIEALNRRTEREWLHSACRSAAKAGKGKDLLAFFEKQHVRSPRDVRWAVAVRDIKQAFNDVDGAIDAAKAAVTVRPEKEGLWREAVDLLVRGDRIREAADYLEVWNRPRPADEGVARWRGELYIQAGEPDKALALEQATLAAFAKEAPEKEEDLANRKARAAERMLEQGFPDLGLRLYSSKGDIQALADSKLSAQRQCQIALLTNQFVRLLNQRAEDEGFMRTAPSVFQQQGRPEQNEEVQAFLLRKLYPLRGQPNDGELNRWWAFVGQAGLEPGLRVALAQRLLSVRTGPWQNNPPVAFARRIGQEFVTHRPSSQGSAQMVFREPDLPKFWMEDLARRDRSEELLAFIEPRWQELLGQVKGPGALRDDLKRGLQEPGNLLKGVAARVTGKAPFDPQGNRLYWANWLDDGNVLQTWARAAQTHPQKVRELSEIMADRPRWDRFWLLAARQWNVIPLVTILPEGPRMTWYRFWEPDLHNDPVLLARRAITEQATATLGRLIKGEPNAANDPLIVKLRGPQTVGEVLGKSSQWIWPEFALRRNAKGDVMEEGDDRVSGQGADLGRLPGALWGERPGEAWYVLEALARYRQGNKTAPFLPLDVPKRGEETSRTLLALRLAQAMGELPLALELEAAHPGPAQDRTWLEGRLSLWVAAGLKEKAVTALKAFIQGRQSKMTEDDFRWLSARAEDLGLTSPLELLNPAHPVGPVFLAYLRDRRPEASAKFTTADPVGFRTALANRWAEREDELSAEQIRYWLRELWVKNSAGLPRQGLAKLGSGWAASADWLTQQPEPERLAALDIVAESVNPAVAQPRLFALLGAPGSNDSARLLAVRLRLLRGETDQAVALVDAMLAELRQGQTLSYSIPNRYVSEAPEEEGEEGDYSAPPERKQESSSDPLVNRLRLWLRPFTAAKKAGPVEERFRKLLKERRAEAPASIEAWRFAFKLTLPAEADDLAKEVDAAWFRGEIWAGQLGTLSDSLATVLPQEAPRWLARWPRSYRFAQAQERAAILQKLQQPTRVAQTLFEARRRSPWQAREEVQAFDAWRRMGAPTASEEKPPTSWALALPFWKAGAEAAATGLGAHLGAHPYDLLASRAALRSLAPADEETLMRVAATLGPNRSLNETDGDSLVLHLRAARMLLPQSWRAAQTSLGSVTVDYFRQTMVERHFKTLDINQTLADLARLSYKAGDEGRTKAVLAVLDDRRAPGARALRAELLPNAGNKPETFRIVNGRPTPIRPRDLTWPLLASVLQGEGVR